MRPAISLATLLLGTMALATAADAAFTPPEKGAESAVDLAPSPHYTPQQVVEIQLGALAANAEWGDDRGIALTFRFASPGNRAMTGPLPRFTDMVKQPAYAPLLDHQASRIGPIQMHGGRALLPVLLRDAQGEDRAYVWMLGRVESGAHAGCWMTDAVYPARPRAAQDALPASDEI